MSPIETRGRAYIDTSWHNAPLEYTTKLGASLDKLFGLRPAQIERAAESFSPPVAARLLADDYHHLRAHRDHPTLRARNLMEVFSGIQENCGVRGARLSEAQSSADFAGLLGNTLNRILRASFAEATYYERTISRAVRAADLRAQRVVDVDSPPDPPTVDPEAADYTELATRASRELSYAMLQKGVLLSISRKVILANDVDVITRMLEDLGRAARRTLARSVWTLWTANATYGPDSVAWFNAAHANTGTTALTEASVIAALAQLRAQTMAGTTEKLGMPLTPGRVWLDLPDPLADAGLKLNQTPGSALHHFFGANNEYVAINPLLTDATDWGVHRDARDVESVRIAYLNGREDPEILLADIANAGQLFVGDKFTYKLRLEYGVGLAEVRGAVKNTVAG